MRKDLIVIETDEQNRITRALDMSSAQPIEVPGGDVVFAPVLERTGDGAALEKVDDRPIASTSIYSEAMVQNALSEHYESKHIAFAFSNTITGESGTQAARIAESRTHDHPAQIDSDAPDQRSAKKAVTDGGVATAPTTDGGDVDETCPYCGSPNVQTGTTTKNVQAHSHRATRVAVTKCLDCCGAVHRRTQVTARSTSDWSAPAGGKWIIRRVCAHRLSRLWADHRLARPH